MLSVKAEQALLEVLLRLFLVLLAIVGVHADEVKCVTYQHGLDFLVERARAAKRGRDIDLKEPRLEFVIKKDINSKQLVTIVGIKPALVEAIEDISPSTDNCLDYDGFNFLPDTMTRYSSLLKIIPESQNTPLVRFSKL